MLAQLMGETCKCRDSCQFQGQGFIFFVLFCFSRSRSKLKRRMRVRWPVWKKNETNEALMALMSTFRRRVQMRRSKKSVDVSRTTLMWATWRLMDIHRISLYPLKLWRGQKSCQITSKSTAVNIELSYLIKLKFKKN